MKTQEELQQFYETILLPDLARLEKERKKILRLEGLFALSYAGGILGLIGVVILTGLLGIFVPVVKQVGVFSLVLLLILCCGVPLVTAIRDEILRSLLKKSYIQPFKEAIISRVITFVDDHLEYQPDKSIPRSIFRTAQLFPDSRSYSGDDYVSGKIGDTTIEFSELHVGGSGFHGIFFAADFHKPFSGFTVVHSSMQGEFPERLVVMPFETLAKMDRRQLVTLEDPEFTRRFIVHSDNQIQARYILSPALMRRIVEFSNKTYRPIQLSFAASKVFIAIPYNRALFEPRLEGTIVDIEPIREYVEDFQLALSLVEDLKLNTRIWGNAPPVSDFKAGMRDIIKKYEDRIEDRYVFFSPNIPEKKLRHAAQHFAPFCSETETPLALIDGTILGSAARGCLITDQKLYTKKAFERPQSFPLSKLGQIQYHPEWLAGVLLVNNNEILSMPTQETVQRLADMLQEIAHYRQSPPLQTAAMPSQPDIASEEGLSATKTMSVYERFVRLPEMRAYYFPLCLVIAFLCFAMTMFVRYRGDGLKELARFKEYGQRYAGEVISTASRKVSFTLTDRPGYEDILFEKRFRSEDFEAIAVGDPLLVWMIGKDYCIHHPRQEFPHTYYIKVGEKQRIVTVYSANSEWTPYDPILMAIFLISGIGFLVTGIMILLIPKLAKKGENHA